MWGLVMQRKKRRELPLRTQRSAPKSCLKKYVLVLFLLRDRTPEGHEVAAAEEPVYTVTFAYQDGTAIEKKTVHAGKGVFPPEFETEGVFRGWSSPFNAVASDVETHPMVYQVADENLFCFDSVYTLEGTEFTIGLKLTGAVNLSTAEVSIEYDPLVMEYVGSVDCAVCIVEEEASGALKLRLRSSEPIREPILLSELTFLAKPEDVYATQIDLRCENAKLLLADSETPVTASTLNNQIYYLQEVE